MKFSLSSFLFTALLVPSTEVKGACTWALNKGTGISGGFAGGTVAQQFSTVELAQAKCYELGMLVCKAVSCTPSACSVYTGDTLAMVDYDATSYLPSADCVALADRWNIGNVTASNAGSEFSFQYAEMSRLWLGTFAGGENTGEKITATIYGEFCMVDEFLNSCNWQDAVQDGMIPPGDLDAKDSYADGYEFELTLVEAQVKCLQLGAWLCKAVTCLAVDNGLCTVRSADPYTTTFVTSSNNDRSYGLPSNVGDDACTLRPSAKEDTYTSPRPFSDPSLTWTNVEIQEKEDENGNVVVGEFIKFAGDALFLQYTVSGDPLGMEASAWPEPEYGTVTGASPELKFCVRLGLYAHTPSNPSGPVSEEINFFESVVTVTVDFNGNFKVLGIGVAPKEQGQTTAAVVYTASAELCGASVLTGGRSPEDYGQAVKVDKNFNQGAAIMVCISLDDAAKVDDVEINQIKSFIWTQETAGSTPKTQVGIDADGLAGNGLTIQSPIQNSPVGTENVIVTSVLFAAFYEEVGSVKASGEVEMSFARRRRLGTTDNRRLQEADPIAAFDVDATLNKADDGPVAIQQTAGGNGGTYSISNVVGVAITSIVGLLVSDSVLFA
mmetsp:Transcript_27673/g.31817  ORF Transcript_27673/g.31817 Transcript_27673/m.31817 type:complete len:609 (-) Transcript_27673:477-2303(-)